MTQTTQDTLVHVTPGGDVNQIENSYDGIKGALDGRPFDFVIGADPRFGCYIDDEGLLLGHALNVPVSMMLGRAVYGPTVCCRGNTDSDGDTLPMDDDVRAGLLAACSRWRAVVTSAVGVGQVPFAYADAETVPPPTVVTLTEAEVEAYFGG